MLTPDSSKIEDQWFLQHEKTMLEKYRRDREYRLSKLREAKQETEIDELRDAHWMKCPKCGHDLQTIQLEGIDIDQCSFCEGVYFDRGELDTLLMRKTSLRFKFYRRLFGLD